MKKVAVSKEGGSTNPNLGAFGDFLDSLDMGDLNT
jgi:hypothetical protein